MEKDKKAEVTTEVEDTRPEYMKKRVLVPSITAIIFLICGIFYSIHSVYYKSTDDAFVEGHVITVAPRVAGPVLNLNIIKCKQPLSQNLTTHRYGLWHFQFFCRHHFHALQHRQLMLQSRIFPAISAQQLMRQTGL